MRDSRLLLHGKLQDISIKYNYACRPPQIPETSPIKLEEPEDVLASEPVMLTEPNIPEHDENEIMDEAPTFLCSEPVRSQSVQLPLRTQSEQLPIYGSPDLIRTESCQVQLQALNQAPSLPNDVSPFFCLKSSVEYYFTSESGLKANCMYLLFSVLSKRSCLHRLHTMDQFSSGIAYKFGSSLNRAPSS